MASQKQQRLPQHLHFVLEGLQLLGRGRRHFEDLDRYVSVPLALEDGSEGTRTYPLLDGHLFRVDLPVVTGVSVTPPVLKHNTTQHNTVKVRKKICHRSHKGEGENDAYHFLFIVRRGGFALLMLGGEPGLSAARRAK